MEKETVLEIEFKELWDNDFAWKITKQNEEILKRGIFEDSIVVVNSTYFPDFYEKEEKLYIRGTSKNMDDKVNICTIEEKLIIERKVKAINEKYGIKKRWRANYNDIYFCIDEYFEVTWHRNIQSIYENRRYEKGNYFRTKEEAEEYAEYMKQKSLEWHEIRGRK